MEIYDAFSKKLEVIELFMENGILEILMRSVFLNHFNLFFDFGLETLIKILKTLKEGNHEKEINFIIEKILEYDGKEILFQYREQRFSGDSSYQSLALFFNRFFLAKENDNLKY